MRRLAAEAGPAWMQSSRNSQAQSQSLDDGSSQAPTSPGPLLEASYEELAEAMEARVAQGREDLAERQQKTEAAELRLEEKQRALEETERRIFEFADGVQDVVELNVGGKVICTTREVLCSAKGSLLSGLFSGSFENGHKRDKEGRVFLDVDPPIFKKLLSHLRLRQLASPDCPAPLPHVPDEMRPEYDMVIKYFGLDAFMYGTEMWPSGNIFKRVAELTSLSQMKLQTGEAIRIVLSTTGGVPAANHEEVLGPTGFHERSLENSYGAHPNTLQILFLKHRVRVEAMELRAKVADITAHMSNQWTFKHGKEIISMYFNFTRTASCTGRLETAGLELTPFVDEVLWTFPRDFCIEHIVLHGQVMPK